MSLHEIVFELPGEPLPELKNAGINIAPQAKVEASSTLSGTSLAGLIDGQINSGTSEWASDGQTKGASVKLTWPKPQCINRIRLYDRPNSQDWVHEGTLRFSDGSSEKLRAWLSNGAKAATEIRFPVKEVDWVTFTIDEALGKTPGLAEIEVYTAQ